jgi:hypothetical protein
VRSVQRTAWSMPVSAGEAYARSAGRRHSNAVRQLRATVRRGRVAELALAASDGATAPAPAHPMLAAATSTA